MRSGESWGRHKRKIGEQPGDEIPIRLLPVEALGRGYQQWSGENECESGVI